MYLRRAYDLALQLMGKTDNKRWVKDICLHAINDLKVIGVEVIINPETLRLWNVELRKGAGKFPHPNPNIANGKKNEPAIFESIPQFKSDCLSFIYDNFDNFVVDMLRDNVIDVLIPKHIDRIKVELSQYGLDEADSPELIILRKYISKPPSYGVVLSWLHSMDFK
eukprot:scaffold267828_cov106-Cyclotella_meneghiniana.AAC.1